MARALEAAGFDGLWVADHVVLPRSIDSHYPFAADGKATWPSDAPYVEAMIALALAAAVTERATLGTAVLVLPLRSPVMFAKQAASIDVASNGRLRLGVGAGWLKEEFDALGVPFADRGPRTEEWIAIARDCWTATPSAHESERYSLPADILMVPPPAATDPLPDGRALARGADARRTRRRRLARPAGAARDRHRRARRGCRADARDRRRARPRPCEPRGRPAHRRSAGHADEIARRIPALAAAGVDEIIVDLDWDGDLDAQHATLRAGAA